MAYKCVKLSLLAAILALALVSQSEGQVLVDCFPDANADQQKCEARGCVWQQLGDRKQLKSSAPWCTYPDGYGYVSTGDVTQTELGYILTLNRNSQPSVHGWDVQTVALSVEFWDQNILRLKFYDPSTERYEVPIEINKPSSRAATTDYYVTTTNTPQFGLQVVRNSTGTKVFDTTLPGLVFSDQYLTISTRLPSANVYGFGENEHHQLLHDLNWETWTMFTRDNGPQNSYNLYGVQPFYMNVENDGNTNGVFLLNSNALEIELQPAPALTYWTIGGILDFYIFLGPSPLEVVQQYTKLIGHPYMPPYWGLGFQLSRWGYADTTDLQNIINGMRSNNIPYDVQYTDIDYMDGYKDWTLSKDTFSDLPTVIADLHAHNQRYVPIIDAGIANFDPDYYAYQRGLVHDVFIKYPNGTLLEGNVWPGDVYYPDFSHENAVAYWSEQCYELYNNLNVQYDGIWIDMNEPSNFYVGSTNGCNNNTYNYPPFCPPILGADPEGKLFDKTICMDTVQAAGRHYDIHSLYGYHMTKATANAMLSTFPERRQFLFSRSQFPGSAQYGHHWLGDNESTFEQLRDSIVGILEYNMFGTPFVGADICGFNGETTEELCIRWFQAGSFYSFARNHNTQGARAQDPPSLGPRVVNASIKALTERYRLLPYLYTLLHDAHTSGSMVNRALLHEFPADSNTWGISYQFLWGSALLVSPVVYEGDVSVNAYFPPSAVWYNYYDGSLLTTSLGRVVLSCSLDDYVPLHVRGGSIIPTQAPATTTYDSRRNPLGLIVALSSSSAAEGSLYWDDGDTVDADAKGLYNQLQFSYAKNVLDISVENDGVTMDVTMDNVSIYGLSGGVNSVTVDGVSLDSSNFSYDSTKKVLTLSNLGLELPASHSIQIN